MKVEMDEACSTDNRDKEYIALARKCVGKKTRCKWEDNIKMNHMTQGCGGVDWNLLGQDNVL